MHRRVVAISASSLFDIDASAQMSPRRCQTTRARCVRRRGVFCDRSTSPERGHRSAGAVAQLSEPTVYSGSMKVELARASNVWVALALGLATGCSSDARLAQLERRVSTVEKCAAPAPPASSQPTRPPPTPEAFRDWFMSGGGQDVYDITVDLHVKHGDGPTLLLAPTKTAAGKYGTFMTAIAATPFIGKRVRVSAWTRTEGTTRRADFWARVQAEDSPGDGPGLGGDNQALGANADWTKHEIVMDVPADGSSVQFGVGIAGPGMLWVDDPKVEVVGNDVALTNKRAHRQPSKLKHWFLAGDNEDAYGIDLDETTKHGGKASGSIRSVAAPTGFGTLMQQSSPAPYLGKRVRLSAFIKSEGVEGWAGLWMRFDTATRQSASFDNMEDRPIKGIGDWKKYEVVLDVPTDATNLALGVLLTGPGHVWIDDIKLEQVGTNVPITGKSSERQGPGNLDFEQ